MLCAGQELEDAPTAAEHLARLQKRAAALTAARDGSCAPAAPPAVIAGAALPAPPVEAPLAPGDQAGGALWTDRYQPRAPAQVCFQSIPGTTAACDDRAIADQFCESHICWCVPCCTHVPQVNDAAGAQGS